MFNKNSIELLEIKIVQQGHTVMARVRRKDSGREYTVFNIYSAVGHIKEDYELQFRTIEDFVEINNLYLNRNIIVAGDINLNLFEPSVYSHHYNRFKSFLRKLNLIDVAVKANSHSIPTWRGFGERAASKSCIDVFLCSKDNPRLNFVNYTVHASSSSDYRPVHKRKNLALNEKFTTHLN